MNSRTTDFTEGPQQVAQISQHISNDLEESKENHEYPEVHTFLETVSLIKYNQRFIENGIEDLETILELKDGDLDFMKVPLGHKLKILKLIKTSRQERGMTVPESRQGLRPTSTMSERSNVDVEVTVKKYEQQDYTELPEPVSQLLTFKTSQLKPKKLVEGAAKATEPQAA